MDSTKYIRFFGIVNVIVMFHATGVMAAISFVIALACMCTVIYVQWKER